MRFTKILFMLVLVAFLGLFLHNLIQAAGPPDITFTAKTQGDVTFKHSVHIEKKLACKDCHPGIFKMKKGGSGVTMDAINKGEFCSKCHNGEKAFAAKDCAKCHKK